MSDQAYELLALLMRYVFVLIGLLIVWRAFRWMLILSAFVLAGQAVNSMLFSGKSLSYASLAFLVAFILLSVIAMRSMQMGAEMDVRWHTANSLTVAVVLLVSVGVSLGLYYLYLHMKVL